MKAISLWQPWASGIQLKLKTWETRSWATQYRGDLAIHAAKVFGPDEREFWQEEYALGRLPQHPPLGCVLCVVTLVDCLPTETARELINREEMRWGDYYEGRFAWKLENLRVLVAPIPAKGMQGFWEWPVKLADLKFLNKEAK